jgi:4'-phosphopantetheinyl transferase
MTKAPLTSLAQSSILVGSVEIWRADLSASFTEVAAAAELLSVEERKRANRFLDPRSRAHFIAARAILRQLLAWYLETDPREIVLSYSDAGKPFVFGTDIKFNLAHSDATVVYVFSKHRVGIDVELCRPGVAVMELAECFFSPEEVSALKVLAECDILPAFYRCWTRKEAYLKAIGLGLSRPLNSFVVSIRGGQTSLLCSDELNPNAPCEWTLVDLPQLERDGFSAAVAVEWASSRNHPTVFYRRLLPAPILHWQNELQ